VRGWNREVGVVGEGVARLMRARVNKSNRKKPARVLCSSSRGHQIWYPTRRQTICLDAPFRGSVARRPGDGI
jgi:hypothetical protein